MKLINSPAMKCNVKDVLLGPMSPMAAISPVAVNKITSGCQVYVGKTAPPVCPWRAAAGLPVLKNQLQHQ